MKKQKILYRISALVLSLVLLGGALPSDVCASEPMEIHQAPPEEPEEESADPGEEASRSEEGESGQEESVTGPEEQPVSESEEGESGQEESMTGPEEQPVSESEEGESGQEESVPEPEEQEPTEAETDAENREDRWSPEAGVPDTVFGEETCKIRRLQNRSWEAWIRVTDYDAVTGQTDASLAGAEFSVFEYDRDSGDYSLCAAREQQIMKDLQDGTYEVGPLYYDPANEGKFMIRESRSPYGYTIDPAGNCFYFQITGEYQVTMGSGNPHNQAGVYQASPDSKYDLRAYNEPWKVKVEAFKADEDTGSLLSGVRFDVLRFQKETGDYEPETSYAPGKISVFERQDKSYESDWIYWNHENQGKFYLVESQTRKGYFGDWKERILEMITGHPAGWQDDDVEGKNVYYFQITGSRTEKGIVPGYNSQTTVRASVNEQGNIANERTRGRVTVVKYDTETESSMPQGEGVLEGAVYELRAAEDIIHADGKTGVLYQKGELVMTGTIGRTPETDKHGYILNTEGKRYGSHGGEIAFRNTPGEFSLYNIELGKYTLKEVKASPGYMLDETTYELTFTYEDERERVILRDEKSGDDKNTLMSDDEGQEYEKIRSGGYIQKQAFSLMRTSDAQHQTELLPVEGAGFTVYLVSELSGVKKGELSPLNGQSWTDADIQSFCDYDFSQEKPATVYKRENEKWTEGDRKWLEKVPDGAPNEYRVRQMFTDKRGSLTSPELPSGTYVAAETTVSQDHGRVQPFFVYITADGGVVYTDDSRETIKKRFDEETDIRYGDHDNQNIYRDEKVFDEKAVEGRVPQRTRYLSDDQREIFLRLVKADRDFLPSEGSILRPEEAAPGTVLKEGARYRIRVVDMTAREAEILAKNGWKKDKEGYIQYYEPASKTEYGTAQTPFCPALVRDADARITDCYLTLPAQLPAGVYEVTELSAPSGYVQNGKEQTLQDVDTDRENIYEIKDTPQSPIQFALESSSGYTEGKVEKNKYTFKDWHGDLVCTVLQGNQEQKGILELIKKGEKLWDVSGGREKTSCEFIYKEAPVEGAVFDIFAAEDIYTQQVDASQPMGMRDDLRNYQVWSKDQRVGTVTTDNTGYAYLAGLYIGKYYIQEAYAGEGFVLNPEIQSFEITPQDQEVSFVWAASVWENERQHLKIQVEKQDVQDGEPLAGAVYGLYTRDDMYSFVVKNTDKTVPEYRHIQEVFEYVSSDTGRLVIPADTLIAEAVTDEMGRADFGAGLPLGRYYVKELKAPEGYTGTDQREEIDGRWKGQYVEVQEHSDLVFRNQHTRHVFTKSDLVSGVHIPGAFLEVWEILTDEQGNLQKNPDGSYVLGDAPVDAWVSRGAGEEVHYFYEEGGFYYEILSPEELPKGKDLIVKEGHLVEKLTVGGRYVFRETLAPEGYVGYEASSRETKEANREENTAAEEVMFTVQDDNRIVEHDMKNQRAVGAFSVTKEGEFFTGTGEKPAFTDKIKNLFSTVFDYILGRVEHTGFEVYVKEDIFTPDGTGRYAQWINGAGQTITLKKDTRIDTISTDCFGLASVRDLPLGVYYVRETTAGDGAFLINREEKEVVLSYADQNTPVVFAGSVSCVNDRQKVSIRVQKQETGSNLPLEGAVFGLYAAEDLYGYAVSGERAVSAYPLPLVKKDMLLEKVRSDAEGRAEFRADLPNGKYYVRELEAPKGYEKTEEIWYCDASYGGEDGDALLTFSWDVYNESADGSEPGRKPGGGNLDTEKETTEPEGNVPVIGFTPPFTGDTARCIAWGSAVLALGAAVFWMYRKW